MGATLDKIIVQLGPLRQYVNSVCHVLSQTAAIRARSPHPHPTATHYVGESVVTSLTTAEGLREGKEAWLLQAGPYNTSGWGSQGFWPWGKKEEKGTSSAGTVPGHR